MHGLWRWMHISFLRAYFWRSKRPRFPSSLILLLMSLSSWLSILLLEPLFVRRLHVHPLAVHFRHRCSNVFRRSSNCPRRCIDLFCSFVMFFPPLFFGLSLPLAMPIPQELILKYPPAPVCTVLRFEGHYRSLKFLSLNVVLLLRSRERSPSATDGARLIPITRRVGTGIVLRSLSSVVVE